MPVLLSMAADSASEWACSQSVRLSMTSIVSLSSYKAASSLTESKQLCIILKATGQQQQESSLVKVTYSKLGSDCLFGHLV